MAVINIDNVSVYRGRNLVFDNLSLCIESGQHTAIIGPNGAGKTTLMKLIAREIYPVQSPGSTVEIMGRSRWNVWDLRKKLGIVSADLQHRYHPQATGMDVVLSGYFSSIGLFDHQRIEPQQLTKARQILLELGVESLENRRFAHLSTGEQRRCLLGRALIHDPEALIFDEPTTGLDLSATFRYLDTIRTLVRRGTTVVLVTHHLHEIPPEVNRIVLLKNGSIYQEGEKDRVLSDTGLSEVFQVPVHVVQRNGWYQVVPC